MIDYRQDSAVIPLNGTITSDSVSAVIDDVRHLRDDCFYRRLEIAITSPGGDILACERLLEFFDSLRREGMRVDTAGSGQAASSGAFLLSTGDHRRASPGSRLTYHLARTETPATGYRGGCRECGGDSERNRRPDGRPTCRTWSAGSPKRTNARCRDADLSAGRSRTAIRDLLLVLSEGCATDLPSDDAALKRLRKILDPHRLDRRTLETVYRTLLTLDRPISPVLARELLLIDDATGSRPPGRADAGPALRVPEWRAIWPEGRVGARAPVPSHADSGRDGFRQNRIRGDADTEGDADPGQRREMCARH